MRDLVRSRKGAYVALGLLTAIWGMNGIVTKFALQSADPVLLNVQRTCASSQLHSCPRLARASSAGTSGAGR